jgi:hypothetical protein
MKTLLILRLGIILSVAAQPLLAADAAKVPLANRRRLRNKKQRATTGR